MNDVKIGKEKMHIKNIGVFKLKSLRDSHDIDSLADALKLKLK